MTLSERESASLLSSPFHHEEIKRVDQPHPFFVNVHIQCLLYMGSPSEVWPIHIYSTQRGVLQPQEFPSIALVCTCHLIREY